MITGGNDHVKKVRSENIQVNFQTRNFEFLGSKKLTSFYFSPFVYSISMFYYSYKVSSNDIPSFVNSSRFRNNHHSLPTLAFKPKSSGDAKLQRLDSILDDAYVNFNKMH